MSTSAEPLVLPARRLPGDLAMWFFILAELTVFAILVVAFAVTQRLQPTLFAESRQALDSSIGLALTLSLLTSGLLAALAVEAVRRGRQGHKTLTYPAIYKKNKQTYWKILKNELFNQPKKNHNKTFQETKKKKNWK